MRIEDYTDLHLRRLTDNIAQEITNIEKEKDVPANASVESYNNGNRLFCEDCVLLEYPVIDIGWLKKLNVCVMFNSDSIDEFMTMSDTKTYVFDDNDETFHESDVTYKIKKTGYNDEMLFLSDDTCIRVGTILLILSHDGSYMKNPRQLSAVVFHELSHLYDMFERKVMQDELNIEENIATAVADTIANPERWSKEYDMLFTSPAWGVRHCNADIIQIFLAEEGFYLCSESELTARLCNFVRDIDDCRQADLTPAKVGESQEQMLYDRSETYRTITNIRQYLRMFVQYTPDTVKEDYVRRYIIKFWDRPLKDGRLIFGRDFRIDGKYTVGSFDLFFNHIISRIDKYFFERCLQIVWMISDAIKESRDQYLSKPVNFMALTGHGQNSRPIKRKAHALGSMLYENYRLRDITLYRDRVVWAFI